jgi:hypothetical protein
MTAADVNAIKAADMGSKGSEETFGRAVSYFTITVFVP